MAGIRAPVGVTEEFGVPTSGPMIAGFKAADPIMKEVVRRLGQKFPKSIVRQIRTTRSFIDQLAEVGFVEEQLRGAPTRLGDKGQAMQRWTGKKLMEALEEAVTIYDKLAGP